MRRVRPGSGWRGRSPRPGWNAWLPHPRSCSVRPGIGSRPMPVMPRISARLLRLGEITAVRVPEREIEAVRDLVRAREDARADLMRVRHRLSKLLLRQGIVYSGGTPWTCVHEEWLRRHRFDGIHLKAAFDHSFDAVLAATAARDRLDEQIMVVAASPRFADPVNRLGCLRGISA